MPKKLIGFGDSSTFRASCTNQKKYYKQRVFLSLWLICLFVRISWELEMLEFPKRTFFMISTDIIFQVDPFWGARTADARTHSIRFQHLCRWPCEIRSSYSSIWPLTRCKGSWEGSNHSWKFRIAATSGGSADGVSHVAGMTVSGPKISGEKSSWW